MLSIGSAVYMPPEAITKYQYSQKSDVWAIGVILYEILFKKTPWYQSNKKKILRRIIEEPIKHKIP